MSTLRVLRSLVRERLKAAAEDIVGLVERAMVEYEEEMIRVYKPAERPPSPALKSQQRAGGDPRSLVHADSPQLPAFVLEEPESDKPEPPTIKEEQEETWTKDEGHQRTAGPDTDVHLTSSPACKIEQPQGDAAPSSEPFEVKVQDEDALPCSPSELPAAPPPPQPSLPADLPPADDGSNASCFCKVCGVTFSHHGLLVNHAETHADSCACAMCGKLLPSTKSLLEHLQTHAITHICTFCGKTFRRQVDLSVHMRRHTGEKPFSCRVCRKGFTRKANMEIHMRTHTGEKPYRCGVCGRCFNIASSMYRHTRTHSGERPYSCCFCLKGFTTSYDMKKHARTHTGEKLYACPVCSKGYSHRVSLHKHLKLHTG